MRTCPQCGRETDDTPANRQRPFCSERCRMLDLGAWLDERYTVPAVEPPSTEETPARDPDVDD